MNFSNIGSQIKTAHERAKLSQGALAKKSGIAQSTLSYIEKGENHRQWIPLRRFVLGLRSVFWSC